MNNRLTYQQLAEETGVKAGTLKRWKHEGMPAYVDMFGRVRFELGSVEDWIARRRSDVNKNRRLRGVSFRRESVVYFARMSNGSIKIGWSSDQVRREGEIDGEILVTVAGDKSLEASFHRVFAADHIEDELFRASDRLLAFIDGLIALRTVRVA